MIQVGQFCWKLYMTYQPIRKLLQFFISVVLTSLLLCAATSTSACIGPVFNKAAFFNALSGNDLSAIDAMLTRLHLLGTAEQPAYEGALLMKKAGLSSKAREKLQVFKKGRAKLEQAIQTGNGNPEFHFLRLIIQEQAPKIVKYKTDLDNDARIIKKSFIKLPQVVQQAVLDYTKISKVLNAADF